MITAVTSTTPKDDIVVCINKDGCISVMTRAATAIPNPVKLDTDKRIMDTLIHTTISSLGVVLVTAVIIVVLFSLGMFEAVGIQFGMDQMVEASSDQISAFTHTGTTGV